MVNKDECNRPDTTLAGLAGLQPVKGEGKFVTAGNASQLSDGAAAVVLMEAKEAERRGLFGDDVSQFGIAQQRLGRNAPDVEADPAPVLGFDDGRVEAQLRAADGRDVSAGAGTEDDDVIVSHGAYPSRERPTRTGKPGQCTAGRMFSW